MREAIIQKGAFVSGWGQYVHIKCMNCGKLNGVWAYAEYVAADCDCGLYEGRGRIRTEAHFTPLANLSSEKETV